MPASASPRPRVVIVGAGFGGLAAARALRTTPVSVTVVDRDNYHGFWPLLYQVATAGLGPEDIASPVRAILADHANVTVRLGTVASVDLERRLVHLDTGPDLPYDYLIMAAGSSTSDFGIPGVDEHAFPLKTLPDAVRLRNHVLAMFESADSGEVSADEGALTMVAIGGGSTGVEMAGALSELIATNLVTDFPNLDMAAASVVLVEMTDHLLGGFSSGSQAEAVRALRAKGVDVRFDTKVAEVSAGGVTFEDGSTIATRTVVWTAGVRANPVAASFPGDKGKGGTVKVGPDLSIPGHPEVFVVGDMADAAAGQGDQLPQLAQVAIQGGRHAARGIVRRMKGQGTRRFRYHNHGIMATIGRRDAVAELPGGIAFSGTLGWLAWLGVHLVFLVGFRNRVVVLTNWAWNYLTWDRANRVILDDGAHTPSGQLRA